MNKIKKICVVLLSLLLIIALLGCRTAQDQNQQGEGQQQPSETGEKAGGNKPYIAVVSKGFQHQFWQAVKTGALD